MTEKVENFFDQGMRFIKEALTQMPETEVVCYDGAIDSKSATKFIKQLNTPRHKKVALLLQTPGGDADAAYRIARHLQLKYLDITLVVYSYCKSAGTLIAFGANTIKMADVAELGPLDVQLRKVDELGAMTSGLIVGDALDSLTQRARSNFEQTMVALRYNSGHQISTKSAAELAIALTTGLFSPVLSKIDPLYMAENERNLRIAEAYATRLDRGNLKQTTVSQLIYGYPSHGFVIDRKEASELFVRVQPTEASEELLIKFLPFLVHNLRNQGNLPTADGTAEIFSINEKVESYDSSQKQSAPQPATNTPERSGTDAASNGVNASADRKPATNSEEPGNANSKAKQAAGKRELVTE